MAMPTKLRPIISTLIIVFIFILFIFLVDCCLVYSFLLGQKPQIWIFYKANEGLAFCVWDDGRSERFGGVVIAATGEREDWEP